MLLLRGATWRLSVRRDVSTFQYMLLLRGATYRPVLRLAAEYVSIHAPLARSNEDELYRRVKTGGFNTCSSCEEQHTNAAITNAAYQFQYMLLLRGATLNPDYDSQAQLFQYMLLLRGATIPTQMFCRTGGFNTCSSCEEQHGNGTTTTVGQEFQYMLLLRGATSSLSAMHPNRKFQYMLLLRGATKSGRNLTRKRVVSIHAPLARSNS